MREDKHGVGTVGRRTVMVALNVAAVGMLYVGVWELLDAITIAGHGWSLGLFMVALGPGLFLAGDAIAAGGRRTSALARLVRRARPLHVVLLIAAITACLYDGIRGVEPWGRMAIATVACGAMLISLLLQPPTRSRSGEVS